MYISGSKSTWKQKLLSSLAENDKKRGKGLFKKYRYVMAFKIMGAQSCPF